MELFMKEKLTINLKTANIALSKYTVGFYQAGEELYETFLPQVAEEDWDSVKSLEDYKRFWASLLDYIEWISDEDPDIPFIISFSEENDFFKLSIKGLYKKWRTN